MRQRKEDSKTRERNLEEQLAAESSANQELQVRFASKFSLHSKSTKIENKIQINNSSLESDVFSAVVLIGYIVNK